MSTQANNILIIGAGQAAATVALGLRRSGFSGGITMVGDEAHPPYERPQLSKELLITDARPTRFIKSREEYDAQSITLFLGRKAVRTDLKNQTVELDNQQILPFGKLVIATGVRAKPLPLPLSSDQRTCSLRTIEDAQRLQHHIAEKKSLVIIGGGVIGLEVAAAAAARGCKTTVIEAASTLMSRSIDATASNFLLRSHVANGIDIYLSTTVSHVEANGALVLSNGKSLDADLILGGIGVVPNSEAFEGLGLTDEFGISVDANGCTSHPNVYATGDIASQMYGDTRGRIETWANALNLSQAVIAHLLGLPSPPPVPRWFWSDQGQINLQVTGNALVGKAVIRGDSQSNAFSIYRLDDANRVLACTTINSPKDMAIARRWISHSTAVDPSQLSDLSIALRECTLP